MKEFHVVWHIEVNAKNHYDAAERALKLMRDPQSSKNDIFDVSTFEGGHRIISLVNTRNKS